MYICILRIDFLRIIHIPECNRVSDNRCNTCRGQVEQIKLNRKVNFVIMTISNELLINTDLRNSVKRVREKSRPSVYSCYGEALERMGGVGRRCVNNIHE